MIKILKYFFRSYPDKITVELDAYNRLTIAEIIDEHLRKKNSIRFIKEIAELTELNRVCNEWDNIGTQYVTLSLRSVNLLQKEIDTNLNEDYKTIDSIRKYLILSNALNKALINGYHWHATGRAIERPRAEARAVYQ